MDAERAKIRQLRNGDAELDIVLVELERRLQECTDEMQVINESACHASWKNSEALASIGHEIASPLSDVIRLAQLMQELELDSSQEKCIETIIQSCRALMQSLYGAADLSRLEEAPVDEPATEIPNQILNRIGDVQPLVDLDYVKKMKSDFPDGIFASLVQQYCCDIELTLRNLEHAVDSRDVSTVKNLLHLLKGCSANFGAPAVVEFCSDQTERLMRSEDMTKSDFVRLKQIYEDTKDRLLQVVGAGT